MKNKHNNFSYSISSVKGIKPINEDSAWIGSNKTNQCLAIVCDGISSETHSEIASHFVTHYFEKQFTSSFHVFSPKHWFKKHLNQVYNLLHKKCQDEKLNVGTTIVMTLITNKTMFVFTIGDSRTYHFNSLYHSWNQVTRDHNLYNYLEDTKAPESVFIRNKNMLLALTRYIDSNTKKHMTFDTYRLKLNKGDLVLLASDGLYNYIDIEHINSIKAFNENGRSITDILCEEALKNRSNDNISGILIEVTE
ncbi:PP2C-like serine/threonine protein phosphatase [Candidatus Malacoplasma girerdii]|uniref:PP2C-like serine/threonine protein phosphatase n=1 Tax=Candidatus Malacoplasma girerdii TaxID=1318617 RepID=A0A097SS99_9BACT|nr:PP2C-like serine/threonine protein phosphatase [Candidatus Malacoplasma girerdii]